MQARAITRARRRYDRNRVRGAQRPRSSQQRFRRCHARREIGLRPGRVLSAKRRSRATVLESQYQFYCNKRRTCPKVGVMAYGRFPDLSALADAIADDLCVKPSAPIAANPRVVAKIAEDSVRENLRAEEEISREAERALAALGGSAAGMDQQKLLSGMRERIAKKRGFVL